MAAMHYNGNGGRQQAISPGGSKKYRIAFPKYKEGGHTVQKVLVEPSFGKDEFRLSFFTMLMLSKTREKNYCR